MGWGGVSGKKREREKMERGERRIEGKGEKEGEEGRKKERNGE